LVSSKHPHTKIRTDHWNDTLILYSEYLSFLNIS
jgi:hypothetical protein